MNLSEQLFRYATGYAKRSERAGKGTQHPTFRRAAKRFRCRLADIESACESYSGDGYMQPAVAIGIPGVGSADFDCMGDWLVEAYE